MLSWGGFSNVSKLRNVATQVDATNGLTGLVQVNDALWLDGSCFALDPRSCHADDAFLLLSCFCCDWHRRPLQPDGRHAPEWQAWCGVSGGPVIWLRGRFLTSGVTVRQCRHLGMAQFVTFAAPQVSRQTAYTSEGRQRRRDGKQKELWLLMTGCAVLWKAMLRFFSLGTPVDIFEGVIVGNHRIALRFKGSIFKYNQYSIQLFFFFLRQVREATLHIQPL